MEFGFGSKEAAQEDAQEEAQEASQEDPLGAATQEVAGALRLITFSSDYGPTDEYVGVCHLVMAQIAPGVRVIDLVHGIRTVRAGSALLAQSLPFSPGGAVHLAVVDPGVGTDRRAVVITTGDGSLLVGPDNGLLMPSADALGGASAANELIEPAYRLDPVSATFHGRDVFAPAAAHLAIGVSPGEFGPDVETASLVRPSPALVLVSDGALQTDVLRSDWYGNLVLAATREDFTRAALSGSIMVTCGRAETQAVVGRTFADAKPGDFVTYVDSADRVAVARNGGSARDFLQDPERLTLKRK